MRNAERVTFGGSGLNRASELRGSAKASPREGDLFIIHWRGKFAIDLKNACELALIKYPNKIISNKQIIFLGRNKDVSYFATDISEWEPIDQDEIDGSFYDKTQQFHEFLGKDFPFWELEASCTYLHLGLLNWLLPLNLFSIGKIPLASVPNADRKFQLLSRAGR